MKRVRKYRTVRKLMDARGVEYARTVRDRETGEETTFTKAWTDGTDCYEK